jgi:threonylcarbamoyladenosine tRNA methylthiotransferase MtaB
MDKKRVAVENLGCKLNYAETIQIEKEFRRRGFDVVDPSSSADVFVISTCTVTRRADSDCRQIVRRALRISPEAFVVVTGCYAQGKPDEVAQIEGVDLVLGAKEKFSIFDYAGEFKKQKTLTGDPGYDIQSNYHAQIFVGPVEDAVEFGAADSASTGARTRAFLKVQDGCDYNCSYCTIPAVRGISRSPSIAFLVEQAKQVAAYGFKEIVLTGVNVGDYGQRSGDSFLKLLIELEKLVDIERIRISSIEPNLLTKEIIKFVASSSKYCKHFHIPLQNGSDEVLRRMRRRYNSTQYREIVERVKEIIPNAGIGADVIVGFPGETNEHFEESVSFIENLPLSYLHVFSYSEREGTDAARYDRVVDPIARKKRSEILRMISEKKRYEFNRQHVGKIVRVLVEEEVKDGKMFGFTSNYVRVEMTSNPSKVNEICDVLVTGVSDNTVIGQVIL